MTRLALLLLITILPFGSQGTTRSVSLDGRELKLHLYGPADGHPVILSSGDGGWMHLAPHLADLLSARGYFVIGVDSRSYLSGASGSTRAFTPDDIARDYAALLAMFGADQRAVLAGVSEGAGLSLVAAADPRNQPRISGVVALGLGERNELAWHWKDAIIYVTKGVPPEPTFNASQYIPRVAPLPLAFIRPTRDEFVPVDESDRLIATAAQPSKTWTITASDHAFSDNLSTLDRTATAAITWIAATRPGH